MAKVRTRFSAKVWNSWKDAKRYLSAIRDGNIFIEKLIDDKEAIALLMEIMTLEYEDSRVEFDPMLMVFSAGPNTNKDRHPDQLSIKWHYRHDGVKAFGKIALSKRTSIACINSHLLIVKGMRDAVTPDSNAEGLVLHHEVPYFKDMVDDYLERFEYSLESWITYHSRNAVLRWVTYDEHMLIHYGKRNQQEMSNE